jgi:hypothetical protein
MRKIVITSGLGLVAVAMPAHGAVLPLAVEPAGVSEAGRVGLADQGTDTQGVVSGPTQIKLGAAGSAYDKMNADAQLKIKGQYKFNKAGENQTKAPGDAQIKMKPSTQKTFKAGDFQYGSGGSEGVVRPNCLQPGQ